MADLSKISDADLLAMHKNSQGAGTSLAQLSDDELMKMYQETAPPEPSFMRKHVGKPLQSLGDTAAGAFWTGGAALTEDVADIAKYVGEKTGIASITDFLGVPRESTILRRAAERVKERAAKDFAKAEELGAGPVTKFIGEAAGGAIPGITEFVAGPVFAGLKGAETAEREGGDALAQLMSGAKSAGERLILGKLFEGLTVGKKAFDEYSGGLLKKYGVTSIEDLSARATTEEINQLNNLGGVVKHYKGISDLPLSKRIPAMAATFGTQSIVDPLMAGKPVEPAEVAKAMGTGALYAFGGGRKPEDITPSKVADKNFSLQGGVYSPYEAEFPKTRQKLLPGGEGNAAWGAAENRPTEPPVSQGAVPGAPALEAPVDASYGPGSPNYSIVDALPGPGLHVQRAMQTLNIGSVKDIPINPEISPEQAAPGVSLQEGAGAVPPQVENRIPGNAGLRSRFEELKRRATNRVEDIKPDERERIIKDAENQQAKDKLAKDQELNARPVVEVPPLTPEEQASARIYEVSPEDLAALEERRSKKSKLAEPIEIKSAEDIPQELKIEIKTKAMHKGKIVVLKKEENAREAFDRIGKALDIVKAISNCVMKKI